jgi:YidC/Oxa1 family membrane protein insertase
MSNVRLFLLMGLALVGLQLWSAWQADYGPRPEGQSVTDAGTPPASGDVVPTADAPVSSGEVPAAPSETTSAAAASETPVEAIAASNDRRIVVESDVLRLTVSTRGAEIRQVELLTYPISLERKDVPVKLLNEDPERYFVSQTGLVAKDLPAPDHTAMFEVEGDLFQLAAGSDAIEVPLTWTDPSGISVRKVIRLERSSFTVGVRHEINNQSAAPWRGSQYRQMQRVPPPKPHAFAFNDPELYAYVGAAIYSPDEKFQKLKFDNFLEEPYQRTFAGGWSAMQQHYFVGAWVPDAAEQTSYETAILQPNGSLPTRYLMRQKSPPIEIAPGATQSIGARLYLGPKLQNELPKVAPGLQYTVDYGMVAFIAQPLFWVLSQIHKLVGNWGVAIMLLTLLVKLAFYRLSESQYRSMAKMRKLQPRLEQLKERYGDDRQKMAQAQMDLFKQEKVNPIGGCLPILLQLPVFFALYWVIFEAVELRQAPFFLWIPDLSLKDPLYILPVLNVAVMWYTQKLSPTPGMDPVQKKVLQTMPLIFGVMFAFFPAGLVLYWLTNGVLGLIQQVVITKRIEASK